MTEIGKSLGMSQRTGIRGTFLHLLRSPWQDPDDSVVFHHDGLLVCHEGRVLDFGPYSEVLARHPQVPITEIRDRLIVPGFIDCHLHFAQTRIIGSYGKELLEWLAAYVFPEEARLQSKDYADEVAHEFFDLAISHGTTTVQSFATTSPNSVRAFFEEATRRNMRVICGLTGIDREGTCPDYYRDSADSFYEGSAQLIEEFHERGRNLYSICPRFALGSTHEQMTRAGQLRREYPQCWVNTHLSENPKEIETVLGFFPDAPDYLEVYERYGLVGPRFSAGHSIYLSPSEFERMAQAGAAITFCPSSNLFLGSGLLQLDMVQKYGVRLGLGCDSGGGNTISQLQTLDNAYKVGMLQYVKSGSTDCQISALRGLYLLTLGSAHSLYLDDRLGNFEVGKEADFVALDCAATPSLKVRNRKSGPANLEEAIHQFFGLMMLGDDRCVDSTYIAGQCAYRRVR